jgi:hypothetical protein
MPITSVAFSSPLHFRVVEIESNHHWNFKDLQGLCFVSVLLCVHDLWHVHEYVNSLYFMNMNIATNAGLEQALALKLQELLSTIPWLRGRRIKRVSDSSGPAYDIEAVLPCPRVKPPLQSNARKNSDPAYRPS